MVMACNTGVHYEGEGLLPPPPVHEWLKGVNELTQRSTSLYTGP